MVQCVNCLKKRIFNGLNPNCPNCGSRMVELLNFTTKNGIKKRVPTRRSFLSRKQWEREYTTNRLVDNMIDRKPEGGEKEMKA
jgi:hypothetical protein